MKLVQRGAKLSLWQPVKLGSIILLWEINEVGGTVVQGFLVVLRMVDKLQKKKVHVTTCEVIINMINDVVSLTFQAPKNVRNCAGF